MTDQNTPITNGNKQNPAVQQPKKNFFGGEVNFNDANFEVQGDSTPTTDEIAPNPYAPEPKKAEEIISFEPEIAAEPTQTETDELAGFDPFGDDDEDNEVADPAVQQGGSEAEEEFVPEENPTKEPLAPIEEEIDNEEGASRDSGLSLSDEATEEEETTEKEDISNEETIEIEPSKKTGNELFDKFLSLTDTARAIFALQEDKSNFKIIGGKTSDNLLEYFVYLIEDEADHIDLFIKKVETQDDEEDEHLLQRTYTTTSQHLDIFVDEMLLYQFTKDNKEANGVTDKLNKF
ncbi:hypothetical protein FACS1894176_03600 [Bacteroidia bacterium]|nr:hypothetical protein FACS1894176_03600 [Bacteroidia bacterium]